MQSRYQLTKQTQSSQKGLLTFFSEDFYYVNNKIDREMIEIGTKVIFWMVWISGVSFYRINDTIFNSNQFDIREARQVIGAQKNMDYLKL